MNEPGCSPDLDRIEQVENSSDVTLNVIVGFTGDEDKSCPTAYSSRTAVITLSEPHGARVLFGCRPDGSYVPKGGYNSPAFAILAIESGLDSADAVEWVRQQYDDKVVETPLQRRWVEKHKP